MQNTTRDFEIKTERTRWSKLITTFMEPQNNQNIVRGAHTNFNLHRNCKKIIKSSGAREPAIQYFSFWLLFCQTHRLKERLFRIFISLLIQGSLFFAVYFFMFTKKLAWLFLLYFARNHGPRVPAKILKAK